MKSLISALCVAFAILSIPFRSFADIPAPAAPGPVEEQKNEIPAPETPLATVYTQLESQNASEQESALLWLLRSNKAEDLGDFAFPKNSIRFGVERVVKRPVAGIAWRLVECRYLARAVENRDGKETRATTSAAYLFDDLGQLRDWLGDCRNLSIGDFNQDGRVDLAAYIASPKRVIVQTYDRGRSREILRVDQVPPRGPEINKTIDDSGRLLIQYAQPVQVEKTEGPGPRLISVAEHGAYQWDPKEERYVPAPESPKE